MAGESTYFWDPDYAVHPGVLLKDTIHALDLTQVDLARRTGLSTKHINQIIQGAASITPDTALALERVTRVPARVWNGLEANYQSRAAQLREREEIGAASDWLDRFPLAEMKKRKLIPNTSDKAVLFQSLLEFFGVASPGAWKAVWSLGDTSFRKSRAFKSDPYAVATWLREGEVVAVKRDCKSYNRANFLKVLKVVRKLTREDPEVFETKLVELCAAAGVALVLVNEISRTRVSGAARWVAPDRALIQLSLRGKWEDLFWFSFFHEAGHILRHSKKRWFIDEAERTRSQEEMKGPRLDSEEVKADVFAADFLIPQEFHDELFELQSEEEIKGFASAIGVSPAIVLGRLKYERIIPWNRMNHLRRRYSLTDD